MGGDSTDIGGKILGSTLTGGLAPQGREILSETGTYETSAEKKKGTSAADAAELAKKKAEEAKKARLEKDRQNRMSIFQTGSVGGEEVASVKPRGTVFGN